MNNPVQCVVRMMVYSNPLFSEPAEMMSDVGSYIVSLFKYHATFRLFHGLRVYYFAELVFGYLLVILSPEPFHIDSSESAWNAMSV